MSARADESQPNCAMSGEKFETFWDHDLEEWRYKDAVVLTGADAAK